MNQVILVGRVVKDIEIIEKDDKKFGYLTIAVNRNYKNEEGIYETDFITCQLWAGILNNAVDYLKKADTVGIKGRVQQNDNNLIIIAERITFLSSNKKVEKKEDDEGVAIVCE